MDKTTYVSYWLRCFLMEYMVTVRNLSDNTRRSYRDSFKQLLPYTSNEQHVKIDEIKFCHIDSGCIKRFLLNLEVNRKCTINTRNQRLAAIHAFAGFVSHNCPELVEWSRLVHFIPMKKDKVEVIDGAVTPCLHYLEKDEMNALLDAPDRNTVQGQRDYALLIFLYNSGARASEAASLTIGNLLPGSHNIGSQVIIHGKGNKKRTCPLWKSTIAILKPFINGRADSENVFLNRYGEPITRFGIYEMVARHVEQAAQVMPSILKKRVSPHTIRHSTASHLLESGTDINTIRAWLGHVSVNTTNIYAEVNLQNKAKALKTCEIKQKGKLQKSWKTDKGLMDFLTSL